MLFWKNRKVNWLRHGVGELGSPEETHAACDYDFLMKPVSILVFFLQLCLAATVHAYLKVLPSVDAWPGNVQKEEDKGVEVNSRDNHDVKDKQCNVIRIRRKVRICEVVLVD